MNHPPTTSKPPGFSSPVPFQLAPTRPNRLQNQCTRRPRTHNINILASDVPNDTPSSPPSSLVSIRTNRIVETSPSASFTRIYESNKGNLHCKIKTKDLQTKPNNLTSIWSRFLALTILPSGFPASVTQGYASWVRWHIARQVFRNAYYVLGTTSLLRSLGLGNHQSIVVGAALKWVLKDGLGMASKLGVSARLAGIVDRDPRMWRMLGDSIMALAALVEISSVLKPECFLIFGTVAAVLKEAAGAMSGPSYRVFLDAFARDGNIGDVSSRGEAQVVLGNLVGLGIGVIVVGGMDRFGMAAFGGNVLAWVVLASAHLASTYKAVGYVRLKTLNWKRLDVVVDAFLKGEGVLGVEEVHGREELFGWGSGKRVYVGVSLLEFVGNGNEIGDALRYGNERFIILCYEGRLGVLLREDVQVEDVLRAVLQARRILNLIDEKGGNVSGQMLAQLVERSYEWGAQILPGFLEGLRKEQWSTGRLLISLGKARYAVDTAGK